MPDTPRIPLLQGRALADEVVELLADSCDRLAIAGSIRRGRADVGDVELVCMPHLEERFRQVDMFTSVAEPVDLLHARCAELLEAGTFAHRPDRNGHTAFGRKFKRLLYRGVALDVFSTTPSNWGVILLLRTGPAEFNQQLVLRASQGGWLTRGYFFRDGQLWRLPPPHGAELSHLAVVVPTPEEADVFRALGYAFMPPEQRGKRRPGRLAVPA
jgi:DNA polymerase/3'-5' exonuclease PolX